MTKPLSKPLLKPLIKSSTKPTASALSAAAIDLSSGTPTSTQFDDIYFSPTDGVGESRYHFIEGNALPERFSAFSSGQFTVAETGFGTGLNFLLTVDCWQQRADTRTNSARLHYLSVEKYPIDARTLARIYHHNRWENTTTSKLLAQYPPLTAGCYALTIAPDVQLTLLFGDALTRFTQQSFCADAWFLDGFAPAKNPDLWTQALFDCMATHSRKGTTFATFTAASAVRKGLTAAGFAVRKSKGFGRKRERLLGEFASVFDSQNQPME